MTLEYSLKANPLKIDLIALELIKKNDFSFTF